MARLEDVRGMGRRGGASARRQQCQERNGAAHRTVVARGRARDTGGSTSAQPRPTENVAGGAARRLHNRHMLHRFVLILAALFLPAAAWAQATTTVVMKTELGDIVIALETERAPITATNFLRYVDQKRLDGTVFYRAMRLDWDPQPNGLVQGGTQNDPRRILPPIAHEPTSETGVKHLAGTISMARFEPGSANGDFSIMLSPQPGLDADPASDDADLRAGFAAFGQVTEGMEVIRAIFDAPVDPEKGEGWMKGQLLAQPVKILSVRRATVP
ncbi:MAG TPA: peptidylprolyl isomerase [Croceibacterium sp.]